MLNEIMEFDQYTYPLDSTFTPVRMKHGSICNQLSGTARAMTIIARKLYFEENRPDRIHYVMDNLKAWCGDLKHIKTPEIISPEIQKGWLPDYMVSILGKKKMQGFEKYLMTEPDIEQSPYGRELRTNYGWIQEHFCIDTYGKQDTKNKMRDYTKQIDSFCNDPGVPKNRRTERSAACLPVNRILKALYTLNSRYTKTWYNKELFDKHLTKPEKNDFKKVTYEKIIADAIAEGPLSRYYLVCENDDFSDIQYETNNKTFPFRTKKSTDGNTEWPNATKNKADLIMKTIAVVLLEQQSRDANGLYKGVVPVNKTDLSNWLRVTKGMESLEKYSVAEGPLFPPSDRDIDNVAFMNIDHTWMDSHGWNVIPEHELDRYLAEHPKAVFFSDPGAGAYLQKNKRYE